MKAVALYPNADGTWTARIYTNTYFTGTREEFSIGAFVAGVGDWLRPEKPFRFYWVGDESEIFVARDLESLNRFCGHGPFNACGVDFDDTLTEENRGDAWDYVDENGTVYWPEDGQEYEPQETEPPLITYREALERTKKLPWFQRDPVAQLATDYA